MARDQYAYEFPVYEIARRRGTGPEAGVFHLEGRCHFAAYGSEAARDLVALGALHVARLCFDADPRERTHDWHPVAPIPARRAAARFASEPREN